MGRGWVALFKVPQQVLGGPGTHMPITEAVTTLCLEVVTFGPPRDNNIQGLRAQIPMDDTQALSPTHCTALGKVILGAYGQTNARTWGIVAFGPDTSGLRRLVWGSKCPVVSLMCWTHYGGFPLYDMA